MFRRVFLGRLSTPWQAETAHRIVELLATDEKEFVVENCPPGVGKTTLEHDVAAWVTARDRSIRGLFGSRAENNARRQLRRLKRTLERTSPPRGRAEDVARGLAVDAELCLAVEFGAFRPPSGGDVWSQDEFVVWQADDQPIEEKEPTWSCYGMDSAVLSNRFNLIFWDDVVDKTTVRTMDGVENQRQWWDDEGECQPEWAEVSMADGTSKRIIDLSPGEQVLGAAGVTTVVGVEPKGRAEVFRLTSAQGRQVDVTGNHPLLTPAGWVEAKASLHHGVKAVAAVGATFVDPVEAWMVGAMIGDGCVTKSATTIRCEFTGEGDVVARMAERAEAFGWSVRSRPGRGCNTLSFAKGARDWVRSWEFDGCSAHTKRVPDRIRRAPLVSVAGFLAGLIDTDGAVEYREGAPCSIRIRVVSEQLVRDCQDLVTRFGVRSSVTREAKAKPGYKPMWSLRVSYRDGWALVSELTRHVQHTVKGDRLREWVERLGPEHFDAGFVPDRVNRIDSLGEHDTYGLETADHTYVTGGIVTHNTRLEPGGLLWLVGQRYASVDLYRYALDKAVPVDEDEDGEDVGETRPQYHHVVYRAHYDDRCSPAFHKRDAPPYPEGCLLDPYRLPWGGSGGLRAIQRTKPTTYQVQYQQEDTDPEGVLVPELWILGGIDPVTGEQYPGCWDEHRGLAELPDGLVGPKVSVATVDPSGKKMWALEWWVHTPAASSQSFLMDLERKAMPANELLDWDQQSGRFTGLMEDWQARSVRLRVPISHWVVEVNAAQRYLLAYDHVRRWQRKWGVAIIPHTTGPRKLDPDHGPWTIREHFHSGRVRLPGRQGPLERARIQSVKLVTEVTHWPNAGYSDDCVMACWFFFTHLPKLIRTSRRRVDQGTLPRPSWMLASA